MSDHALTPVADEKRLLQLDTANDQVQQHTTRGDAMSAAFANSTVRRLLREAGLE